MKRQSQICDRSSTLNGSYSRSHLERLGLPEDVAYVYPENKVSVVGCWDLALQFRGPSVCVDRDWFHQLELVGEQGDLCQRF